MFDVHAKPSLTDRLSFDGAVNNNVDNSLSGRGIRACALWTSTMRMPNKYYYANSPLLPTTARLQQLPHMTSARHWTHAREPRRRFHRGRRANRRMGGHVVDLSLGTGTDSSTWRASNCSSGATPRCLSVLVLLLPSLRLRCQWRSRLLARRI